MVLIYKCYEDNGKVLTIPEIRVSQIKEISFNNYEKNKYELFAIISEEITRKSDACSEQNKMFIVRKYIRCDCNKLVMEEILKLIERVDGLCGYNNGSGIDNIVINLNATDYADLGYECVEDGMNNKLDNFDRFGAFAMQRFGGDKGIECICGYEVRELDVCGRIM